MEFNERLVVFDDVAKLGPREAQAVIDMTRERHHEPKYSLQEFAQEYLLAERAFDFYLFWEYSCEKYLAFRTLQYDDTEKLFKAENGITAHAGVGGVFLRALVKWLVTAELRDRKRVLHFDVEIDNETNISLLTTFRAVSDVTGKTLIFEKAATLVGERRASYCVFRMDFS